MKFKIELLIFFGAYILHSCKVYAQINLVPNPSFEVYDTCPNAFEFPYRAIYHAVPWFQPFVVDNSTDYFNPCNTDTSYSLGSPNNLIGYQQGRTGVAYAGFATGYLIPQNNYREYLEVELTDSLTANKKYCVSFYVSFANLSQKAVDGMGAYLSKDSVLDSTSNLGVLYYLPQIENLPGNILNDTLNWVQISGEFYANGGERYITIGNFKDDAHTAFIQNTFGTWTFSYYYIDDVSVIYCDVDAGINEKNWIRNFSVSPNPAKDILTLNNLPSIKADLFVFDLRGRVCMQKKLLPSSSSQTVNIAGLLDGMYFIKIITASGTVSKKFIKE